jgi:hypothetical protein
MTPSAGTRWHAFDYRGISAGDYCTGFYLFNTKSGLVWLEFVTLLLSSTHGESQA